MNKHDSIKGLHGKILDNIKILNQKSEEKDKVINQLFFNYRDVKLELVEKDNVEEEKN